MTLVHLFLIHRYKAASVHYVSPTDDVIYQTERMKKHGIFAEVHSEIGEMVVASVNAVRITQLLEADRVALKKLIDKTGPPAAA
jgi:isocitrate lyase